MLKIVTETNTRGPYKSIVKQDGAFIADGVIFPISVIGDGTIEEWTDALPVGEPLPEHYQKARAIRDSLIAESDWRVIRATETGVPISQEWIDYRQALRDISNQEGFPKEVTWPTEPEV